MKSSIRRDLLALLIAIAVVAAVIGGIFVVKMQVIPRLRGELPAAEETAPETQDADAQPAEIDPALIQYHQTAEFASGLQEVRALGVGADDHIFIGGDKMVRRFSREGKKESEFALEGPVRCLAVGDSDHAVAGHVYVGFDDHVEVFDLQGTRLAKWKSFGDKAVVTSIALGEKDVFVADAGNRVVWHCDSLGTVKDEIGRPDPARKIPGFIITSHYFDVAVGGDDLLYAVNPRALRVEGYTFQGDLESHWGTGSTAVEGFFGCCNPAHLAVLPDGRFVTAEKGVSRIKIYNPQGRFECVVAGPRQLKAVAADLAADHRGRILMLDPSLAGVRVFERNSASSNAGSGDGK
jgi:hypothetical protein